MLKQNVMLVLISALLATQGVLKGDQFKLNIGRSDATTMGDVLVFVYDGANPVDFNKTMLDSNKEYLLKVSIGPKETFYTFNGHVLAPPSIQVNQAGAATTSTPARITIKKSDKFKLFVNRADASQMGDVLTYLFDPQSQKQLILEGNANAGRQTESWGKHIRVWSHDMLDGNKEYLLRVKSGANDMFYSVVGIAGQSCTISTSTAGAAVSKDCPNLTIKTVAKPAWIK